MTRRSTRLLIGAGIVLLVVLITGRAVMTFYTDVLWFGEIGYAGVLWRRVAAITGLRLVTGALGAAVVLVNLARVIRHLGPVQLRRTYGNLEIAEQIPHGYVTGGVILASILAGWWLSGIVFPAEAALQALAWVHRGAWNVADPRFGHDLSFYVFTLPTVGRLLDFLLLVTVWSAVLALVGYVLVGAIRVRHGRVEIEQHPRTHFAVLVAGLVTLFAARYWLSQYAVLLDGTGFAGIVGFTDINARLPAYRILSITCLLAAGALLFSTFRRNWIPALVAVGMLIVAGLGLGLLYPSFIQKLRVVPNELAREDPYIRWNLEYTRRAFGLDGIGREVFAVDPSRPPTPAETAGVEQLLPIWDLEPLQEYFNQREALYGYYQFPSVHYDRYGPPGSERQVGIAVREFIASGLPPNNRTWRTLHLNADQVRGNGAVVAPVTEKTVAGDPEFWLRGVAPPGGSESPPRMELAPTAPTDLDLQYSAVFFGETEQDYLLIDPDADYAGETAVGGILLDSFLRIFAFAWRFGDRDLLFSSEAGGKSLLMHRRVVTRVRALAPFLAWDPRPYPVIADGRIVWIADGYTSSTTFPIAQPYDVPGIGRVRYLDNSVKAVVDGLTGRIDLYALHESEPILDAFSRAFPGLIKPLEEMPPTLRRHLRYPLLHLETQADLLEEYHVNSASAFFSGQNEWQVPVEPTAVGGGRDYAPIYMMTTFRGSPTPEFLVIMPFIARERENMTAMLIVENAAGSYGTKTLLELPRDEQIAGPRQVRTIIEQDPGISAQLSLWRQGGSDVEIGRLRIVPLDGSLLYVQPIFLSGSGSSIPQLQRLIASDGTSVAMAATLDEAIAALVGSAADQPATTVAADPSPAAAAGWAPTALETMQAADRALRAGDFAEFGRLWNELQTLIRSAATGGNR
jgi:hypothetical protein